MDAYRIVHTSPVYQLSNLGDPTGARRSLTSDETLANEVVFFLRRNLPGFPYLPHLVYNSPDPALISTSTDHSADVPGLYFYSAHILFFFFLFLSLTFVFVVFVLCVCAFFFPHEDVLSLPASYFAQSHPTTAHSASTRSQPFWQSRTEHVYVRNNLIIGFLLSIALHFCIHLNILHVFLLVTYYT